MRYEYSPKLYLSRKEMSALSSFARIVDRMMEHQQMTSDEAIDLLLDFCEPTFDGIRTSICDHFDLDIIITDD